MSGLGAVEVARDFPASVACTGSTTGVVSLSFTLDSGASSYFFHDCTDLTPLRTPVFVTLADSIVGPVLAHSTTTLSCTAAPSEFDTGYYIPSFSRNLVGVIHLHDLRVVTTFPLVEHVSSYTVGVTGVPLATFHKEPSSGVLHVTPQLSPPHRSVPVVSGGVGCAAAEGEGIGATGVGGADSRGVGVEAHLVEDTTTSSWWPRPASPLGFLLVPQFPPSPSLQPVAAEHGGVSAGGTGGTEGFVGGGSSSGGCWSRRHGHCDACTMH
ncbi:unnamed protein product [Closterium sp. NIES-54]